MMIWPKNKNSGSCKPNPVISRSNILLLLLAIMLLSACKGKDRSAEGIIAGKSNEPTIIPQNDQQDAQNPKTSNYSNGIHCANVKYYNKRTGTRSTYILNVEVSDGKLVKINFPNGGWMDETHFTAPYLDEKGFAAFVNDKGYEYEVVIRHEGMCTSEEITIGKKR